MSQQLKYIATVFKMALKEILNVMGPESIMTVFRLMGEGQGEAFERRLRRKYKVDKWTAEMFVEKLVKDVIEPGLGEGLAGYSVSGNEITVSFKVCPFKRANMKISDKLYCTYTEGMIETAIKKALGDIEMKTETLIASRDPECLFRIKVK
jgi:hypothetical protein